MDFLEHNSKSIQYKNNSFRLRFINISCAELISPPSCTRASYQECVSECLYVCVQGKGRPLWIDNYLHQQSHDATRMPKNSNRIRLERERERGEIQIRLNNDGCTPMIVFRVSKLHHRIYLISMA